MVAEGVKPEAGHDASAMRAPGPLSGSGPFMEGMLDRISELMGDGASMAAFRFAAFEEGRRIASGHRPEGLTDLLGRLDAVLGHRSEVLLDDAGTVRLRIEGPGVLTSTRPLVQGIGLGVLEGALLAARGRRHVGRIVGGQAVVVVELKADR